MQSCHLKIALEKLIRMTVFAGKIEMVKSKWGLAFSAVISVIASLVMAAGLCSFLGLVTTLDSR